MKQPIRAFLGVALPVLTITAFVILLSFSLFRLSEVERDMRIDASQNMLWVISRAHIATLMLEDAAAKYALNEITKTELELRHDVFLSRINLLNDGPQRRQMDTLGASAEMDLLSQQISALNGETNHPDPDIRTQLNELLGRYSAMLGRAANRAMIAEWDQLGDTLDTSRDQLWQIVISLIGIFLAGIALIAHIMVARGEARLRTRQLGKEKAFSELLISSSGEGIIAVDIAQRCTLWNDAAERLFGLKSTNAWGNFLCDISGFFAIETIATAIHDACDGRSTALFDQPYFLPDQTDPLFVDLRCFPLRDSGGVIGAILLVSDVTKQRLAQREISKHRDHLEQLVQARTRELDAALIRERAMSDIYRHFSTMISHQFRTPLAIVDSALQRLMRRADRLSSSEILDRAGNARNAISRLTRLIDNTLDVARIDSGQIEFNAETCDLGQLITALCNRQKEQIPARQIAISLPQAGPVFASCDPVHAENILENLLSNAVKYSPADSPIAIAVTPCSEFLECSITNVGKLDDPLERQSLFDRHFRAGNAEGQSGIGVGLYLARSLARLQGGDIVLTPPIEDQITLVLTLPNICHKHPRPGLRRKEMVSMNSPAP